MRPRTRRLLAVVAVAVLLALGPAGCGSPQESSPQGLTVTLMDLHNIDELQSRFNQDDGVPRLVLLLSPT